MATDPSGAARNGLVTVCIPHNRHGSCVDDGQTFNSLDCDGGGITAAPR